MPLQEALQHPLQSLVQSIISLQTSGSANVKRYYSFLFRDLPDRRDYADYYILIKEPRSLHGIQDSIKKGIYSSPQAVAYDLFLVWSNAREYNEPGSQVYSDAQKLESYMQKLWNERSPPLPPFASLPRPGSLGFDRPAVPPPVVESGEPKAKRLKLTLKPIKAAIPQPSPPVSTPTPAPPKSRISFSMGSSTPSASTSTPTATPDPPPKVTLKLGALKQPTPSASVVPLRATSFLPPRASVPPPPPPPVHVPPVQPQAPTPPPALPPIPSQPTPPPPIVATQPPLVAPIIVKAPTPVPTPPAPEPPVPKPALAIPPQKEQKKAVAAPHFTPAAERDDGWMEGEMNQESLPIYLTIIQKLREYTDLTGRVLATPLTTLPDPSTQPEYYRKVDNPIALDIIEQRVRTGDYPNAEAFDRDLNHLFVISRNFMGPDSPGTLYSDLMTLQRVYHELTKKNGYKLPPSSLTLSSLASVSNGPGNLPTDSSGQTHDTKGQITTRITLKDKVILEGVSIKGEYLRVGDWVYLINPDDPGRPIIAQIFKVYKKPDSPQRCLSVCWYYRPEETVHPASRQFYDQEVFKTSNFVDHVVEDFLDRCFVMFFTKYIRGRPRPPAWDPSVPMYVCEHRYKDDVKSFKKIKNWNSAVPEEIRRHEYDMDTYEGERVDVLKRFKSPFVLGTAQGPGGIGEPLENEEEEQAKYHFTASGEPLTAKSFRAAREAAAGPDRSTAPPEPASPSPSLFGFDQPLNSVQQSSLPPSMPMRMPSLPPPTPIAITPPPVIATVTPVELAAANESFQPLPVSLLHKLRRNDEGDVLWFAAPPRPAPPQQQVRHSLEYLQWRAQRRGKGKDVPKTNGDVEMTDVTS
ncbi:hypothetical protein T439DRAFT_208225 [Meredithblackwellia eburnea MCA 4105]